MACTQRHYVEEQWVVEPPSTGEISGPIGTPTIAASETCTEHNQTNLNEPRLFFLCMFYVRRTKKAPQAPSR